MKRLAGAVASFWLAALGAAGCGGEDNSSGFRDDYNRIVRRYASLPDDIGGAVRGASRKSDSQVARQFAQLSRRLDREVTQLRGLRPPSDAKDEFDAFTTSLHSVSEDLRSISAAARAHSAKRTRAGARSLVGHTEAASKREDALKRAVER